MRQESIQLADGLKLPADIVTETILIVGKRGSGKSSTATRLAEQLYRAGIQFAVLDPPDVWWGLKSSADGGAAGLNVYVFGGAHADLPLEPTGGVLMADVLVEHRISAVISLRQFSNREKARFVSEFAERLYRIKGTSPEPLHLFCEEAHEVMPQQPFKGEEEMLGRMLRLQKLGRTSGIGLTSITQRPASLNKNATTQAEILIAHRLLGPQDRKAIEDWIKYHHEEEKRDTVLATLAELKTGEAWVWAPDFPESKPIGLRRVRFLMPETYDSRRTPKPGEHRIEPKQLAEVDLDKLRSKMAATIERAKADDPKELKKQIATLRAELQKKQPAAQADPAAMERAVSDAAHAAAKQRDAEWELKLRSARALLLKSWERFVDEIMAALHPGEFKAAAHPRLAIPALPPAPRKVAAPVSHSETGPLPRGEAKVLTALAQYPSGLFREQLTVLTGFKRSTRDAYIQRLGEKGFTDLQQGKVFATDAGVAALGPGFDPLPTGSALQDYWLRRLPDGEAQILARAVEAYPKAVDRDALSESTGYKRSTRDAYIQRLAAKELVESVGSGLVRASENLF